MSWKKALRHMYSEHREAIWEDEYPKALIDIMGELESWFKITPNLSNEEVRRLETNRWDRLWPNPFLADADAASNTPRLEKRWLRYDTFVSRVRAAGQPEDQAALYARVLNELGLVHFPQDRVQHRPHAETLLYDSLVNPEWVKWPVYRLIRAESIESADTRPGILDAQRLNEVVGPIVPEANDQHQVRLLMRAYGLLAELDANLDATPGSYDLIIDHLPRLCDVQEGWSKSKVPVVLEAEFPILLPEDLLPRLIGAWHGYAEREPAIIKRSAFLCRPPIGYGGKQGQPALIQADVANRLLTVQMKKRDKATLEAIQTKVTELLRPEFAWARRRGRLSADAPESAIGLSESELKRVEKWVIWTSTDQPQTKEVVRDMTLKWLKKHSEGGSANTIAQAIRASRSAVNVQLRYLRDVSTEPVYLEGGGSNSKWLWRGGLG